MAPSQTYAYLFQVLVAPLFIAGLIALTELWLFRRYIHWPGHHWPVPKTLLYALAWGVVTGMGNANVIGPLVENTAFGLLIAVRLYSNDDDDHRRRRRRRAALKRAKEWLAVGVPARPARQVPA